jgi:phage-related protein
VIRFTAMTGTESNIIFWQGNEYQAYPVEASGFGMNSQGSPPRPTIRASNITGALTELCLAYQDLVGATLKRHRTFKKFLDIENFKTLTPDGNPVDKEGFPDGKNPDADPEQHYPLDVFKVERKTKETEVFVEWELRWFFDLSGVVLPGRVIAQNLCTSFYKSAECGWIPVEGKYFDLTDTACDLAHDACSQSLKACQLRWGEKAALTFGGYPGAGLVRR